MQSMGLFPLYFGDKLFFIERYGKMENEEIFRAVCNGQYIDLEGMLYDKKGQSKIIDITDQE